MAKIALIVEYDILPGKDAAFIAKLTDHAHHTLKEEPGCLRFEVSVPLDAEGKRMTGRIVLNEQYADAEAVAAHERSPRLAALRESLKSLVSGRRFTKAELL